MEELLLLKAVAFFIFLTKERIFIVCQVFDKYFVVGPVDVYKGTYGFPLTPPFKYGQGVRGDSMSLQANNVFALVASDGFSVSFKERVNAIGSNVNCREMRHEIISEHETNENVVKHSTFFILELYFFAYLSGVVVHAIHVFNNGLCEVGNIDKVLARFVEGSIDRFQKFGCFSIQEYAFRNVQMIQTKHNKVGIQTVNDSGLIFMRIGKVTNVLKYFVFAFAGFAAGRDDNFRIGFEMCGDERVKFIHECGTGSNGASIPYSRRVWILICSVCVCIFIIFTIFINTFLEVAGEPGFVSTFALLIQFCDGCNAIECNNDFFFRLKHVNISLNFIANGKNNFGFIYINIFCSEDSFVYGIVNDTIAVCIKVINIGSEECNFFKNGWVAFYDV